MQGHLPYLRFRQCSGTGYVAFNYKLGHDEESLALTQSGWVKVFGNIEVVPKWASELNLSKAPTDTIKRLENRSCVYGQGERMSDIATPASSLLEERAIRKITWRLIPFLMLLYFVAFLDRINVGFAALTMNKDVGLTSQMFGLGSGIFFLGYFVFEVPSTIILHKVGARFWICRVIITWGLVSVAMSFTRGPIRFYALRFLLGLAQAAIFPGIIL